MSFKTSADLEKIMASRAQNTKRDSQHNPGDLVNLK
jgi:hypothetical protein